MDKQEFFLSIEPTAEEIATAEAAIKNNMRAPARGAAKKTGAELAREHKDFQARAYRLWLEATNPAQIERNAEADRLEAEGNKRWISDDGKHVRVYLEDGRYYDVNTGVTQR